MKPVSRRDLIKSMAVLPFASSLGLCGLNEKPESLLPPAASQWFIVLHGLFIVQSPSPRDPKLIRLISPNVDYQGHKHYYRANGNSLKKRGYTLYCSGSGSMLTPDTDSNVVVPKDKVTVRDENTGLAQYAYCWVDLPCPKYIVPLRIRTKDECAVIFDGSAGKYVTATKLPTVTALGYDRDENTTVLSDMPGAATLEYNLVLRSEPKDIPDDEGEGALQALRDCLTLGSDGFKMAIGKPCCPPKPDDGASKGIPSDDETTLEEKSGHPCDPNRGSGPKMSIQPRACMTVFVQ